MGTWDTGPFDNDTAVDWTYELERSTDFGLIEQTLDAVTAIPVEEYLQANLGERAIAATETLARLLGRGGESNAYTETVDRWVKAHRMDPPMSLRELARAALARVVRPPSELLELWDESQESGEWTASIAELS